MARAPRRSAHRRKPSRRRNPFWADVAKAALAAGGGEMVKDAYAATKQHVKRAAKAARKGSARHGT